MIPAIVMISGAVIGAVILAVAFRASPRSMGISAAVGAGAGAAGSLIFMVPLNFCTFEAERSSLDVGFGVLLIALGVAAFTAISGWVLSRVLFRMPLFAAEESPGAFKNPWLALIFLLPTLIILALFLYYPALDTFRLSTLLTRLGTPRTAFVCVDNFTRLVGDTEYYTTIVITLLMSFAIVAIGLVLALAIALLAYQPVKGASIYRTLLIWPYAISPVVAGLIFLLLFNPAGGLVNYALDNVFGISIPWLNNPNAAPWAVIIASVWKSLGFNVLFYIAGLQNVPKDLQEAASIDGANWFQRFFRIVIPLLSPITFFLIITNITYAFFETFGTIDMLTGGGPVGSTTTMMYRIYETGIQNNDLGKAAAQSIVLFALVIGLTVFQFRVSGRRVNYGA
jgi:sn-glycerol 3-phosphate transport system permease protein